jgi:hypothetical protein
MMLLMMIMVVVVVMMMMIQGGSNMTGTNCDLFTHKQSRSYLNHLVIAAVTTATTKMDPTC